MTTGDGTTTYDYDALDRLTEACFVADCATGVDPFIRWTYDPVGNRLTEAAGTTTSTYNPADQLTQTVGPTGTTVYAYDPNGNQTQAGARAFAYDAEHRLTRIVEPIAAGLERTIDYAYDGNGTRLSERIETDTLLGPTVEEIRSVWDPNAALPELALERDGAGATRRRYVYGADLISMTTGGERFVYHHDGLGSAVALTDASGGLEWSYAYEPFGAIRKETRHQLLGAPENRMRFTGEYQDTGSGLYHLRAREYDAGTGRFLSTDPLGALALSPFSSRYSYVDNHPTFLVDPSGQRGDLANGCPWPGKIPGIGPLFCEGFSELSPGWRTAVSGTLNYGGEALAWVGGGKAIKWLLGTKIAQGTHGVVRERRILMPGGKAIGVAGSRSAIRVVGGGLDDAQKLFQGLSKGGKVVSNTKYPGTLVQLPGGKDWVGLRSSSLSGPPTIDVNIPGLSMRKIKFVGG